DYISNNLPEFSAAKAISNAEEAGLKRIMMEHRPAKCWLIKDIKVKKFGYIERPYLITQSLTEDGSKPAVIAALPDGKFGFIGPNGTFKFLGDDIFRKDGTLNKAAILKAMDLEPRSGQAGSDLSCLRDWRDCKLSSFKIDVEY